MKTIRITFAWSLPVLLATACGGEEIAPNDDGMTTAATHTEGVPVLGAGTHDLASVVVTEIAGPEVGFVDPSDLEFHPNRDDELWVISQGDNSMWLTVDPGTREQRSGWFQDRRGGGDHFFAHPSALAFGSSGNFATSQDTDRITQPTTPADFMGPTLWTSDWSTFDAAHGGHLDMLHNSPNGRGIAWESGNVYWIFDAYHESITRYDFHRDHGPGGADHSDGEVYRYVEGEVRGVDGVPSHMALDHSSGTLYIADTGNNRIAALDINTGRVGSSVYPNYDGGIQKRVNGASISTFIDGDDHNMRMPSGLEIHNGMLFVSDTYTGKIYAFDLDDGSLVDWIDTEARRGGLRGMAFDDSGRLYYVDAVEQTVQRLSPASP